MGEVLLVIKECHVFKIPPRTSAGGYKCEEWGKPSAPPLKCKILGDGDRVVINLEDPDTGKLFAQCPVDMENPQVSIEPVVDSSRFFVLKIEDAGRHAFIGMGFKERTQAFDFNVAIQDYIKRVKRGKEPVVVDDTPQVDYSMKAGEKIKISLPIKKKTTTTTTTTSHSSGGLAGLAGAMGPAPSAVPKKQGGDLLSDFGF